MDKPNQETNFELALRAKRGELERKDMTTAAKKIFDTFDEKEIQRYVNNQKRKHISGKASLLKKTQGRIKVT